MQKLNSKQWSNYWNKGTLTTFHKSFQNNYDHEFLTFWQQCFDQIKAGQTVVDLATGNGAVISLLDRHNQKPQLEINAFAVDYSTVNKTFFDQIKHLNCTLLEQTAVESTGLDTGSVDHAYSQYGIEYSDLDQSIQELDRILKKQGAQIHFILHHQSSAVVSDGRSSLAQIEMANVNLDIPDTVKNILPIIDHVKNNPNDAASKSQADLLRDELNYKVNRLIQFANQQTDPGYVNYFLSGISTLFQPNQGNLEDKLNTLTEIDAETQSLQQRMQDLVSVALSDEAVSALCQQLTQIGFQDPKTSALVYQSQHNMGLCLSAER